jgi:hypothetical protein
VASGEVVVETGPTDAEGVLEAPAAGQVVLTLPSPEAREREASEVRRVIGQAGIGVEPLVVVVEATEGLREGELCYSARRATLRAPSSSESSAMAEPARQIDFDRMAETTSRARALYDQVVALYADRINPDIVWISAEAVKPSQSDEW